MTREQGRGVGDGEGSKAVAAAASIAQAQRRALATDEGKTVFLFSTSPQTFLRDQRLVTRRRWRRRRRRRGGDCRHDLALLDKFPFNVDFTSGSDFRWWRRPTSGERSGGRSKKDIARLAASMRRVGRGAEVEMDATAVLNRPINQAAADADCQLRVNSFLRPPPAPRRRPSLQAAATPPLSAAGAPGQAPPPGC
uniref:Uncharacterized protein n=1 Tax=Oryza sativa subsp. japonica TaxID=39947 RepID=Q2R458_ORYSJ|nr:hypothetical protein LOC_Os11g29620 [Oryza sativa Japonica Group]